MPKFKKVKIDGRSIEPFDCPYCKGKVATEDSNNPKYSWEIISVSDLEEIDRMDCPHCGKRIEIHQDL